MNVLISILLIPLIWATKCPINNNIETFIKHESDNTKYYKCLRDGTINEMECAIGFEFNEILSTCTTISIVIGATGSLTAPHTLWKTTVCHGKPDGTHIPNYEIGCQSYYECTNGVPYEKRCATGTLYDINKDYCNWPEEVNCICPISICPNDGIIEDDAVPPTAAPNSTPPTGPPITAATTVAPPTVSTTTTISTVTIPPTATPLTDSTPTAYPPTLPTATSTPKNSVTPPIVGSTSEELTTVATTTEYCETCPTCEPIDLDECPSTVTPSDCPLVEECTTPNDCPTETCTTIPCTTVIYCPEIECPTQSTCPPPNKKKRSNFLRT